MSSELSGAGAAAAASNTGAARGDPAPGSDASTLASIAVDPSSENYVAPECWARLSGAASIESHASAWLEIQCRIIGGVESAVVVLGAADEGPYGPVARWPADGEVAAELSSVAELAMQERRGTLRKRQGGGNSPDAGRAALAYPLLVDERLCGVTAFSLSRRSEAALRTAMHQVQWGCAWLEILVRRKSFGSRDRLVSALELTAVSLEHTRFQPAATAVVTNLATTLQCDWVALGLVRGRHVKVTSLSHSADFAEKANLLRGVRAAMEEAVDQEAVLVYPVPPRHPPRVTRAHETLSRQHGAGNFCTVPLKEGDRITGALMLKRIPGREFDEREVEFCRNVGALVGPIVGLKRRDDYWFIEKPKETLRKLLERLFGARHVGFKLTVIALAAAVAFLATAEGDYRIAADATLEGTVQRVVTAPMDGYVMTAPATAGDVVSKGDVLSTLEDKDLRIERVKWASRREQYLRQYSKALSDRDRAEVRILGAQIAQADAELELLDEQLARTRLVAPFDGLVVKGDLSQSLGVPVQRGQVLFEVAPLDSYRVILKVDEREVSRVTVGQRGTLALAGIPDQRLPMVVEKITPVSSIEDGLNYFRVEARLEEQAEVLRPGMQGVGKIDVERRKWLWIATHKLVDSVRLWWWSWWS